MTKVLANCLKSILSKIISVEQSAFIPDWLITDNLIVGHECLHTFNSSKSGRHGWAAIKSDISKAYDWVNRFFKGVMQKLGFDPKWINIIFYCISTIKFSILINGEAKVSIVPSRGLRQGDPFSPYLFLLIAEGLSSLLQEAKQQWILEWD